MNARGRLSVLHSNFNKKSKLVTDNRIHNKRMNMEGFFCKLFLKSTTSVLNFCDGLQYGIFLYTVCHDNIRIVLENIFGKMTDRHTTICLHVIVRIQRIFIMRY